MVKTQNIRKKYFMYMIPMFVLLLIGEYAYPCLSTDQFNALMPYYMEHLGWTANACSAPVTMGRVIGIPLTFVCGLCIKKWGPKNIFIVSILSYGLAELVITFTTQYWLYYIAFCVLGTMGTWILMTTFSLCNNWFRGWRGTALGLVTAISPISSATIISYMTHGLNAWGFRMTFGMMAAAMLVTALASCFLIRDEPETVGCYPDAATEAPEPEVLANDEYVRKIGLRHIFRHKEGWLHPIAMGFLIFSIPVYSAFFTTRFAEMGYTTTQMTLFTFGFSIFGAVLSFISGVLDDKLGTHRATIVMVVLFFFGTIGLRFGTPDRSWMMWFGIVTLGGIVGATPNLNPSHAVYTYGRKSYDQVYKYLNTLVCIPASFSVSFVTMLYEKSGSYDLAYTIMIPISAMIVICVLLMNRKHDLTADVVADEQKQAAKQEKK